MCMHMIFKFKIWGFALALLMLVMKIVFISVPEIYAGELILWFFLILHDYKQRKQFKEIYLLSQEMSRYEALMT